MSAHWQFLSIRHVNHFEIIFCIKEMRRGLAASFCLLSDPFGYNKVKQKKDV